MRFQTDLIPATLIRRYKRFLADVRLPDGQEVTAHCPNPGAMTGLADPGTRIWLEPNDDPKKKLGYGWRLTELAGENFACVDTGLANKIVAEALAARQIAELATYPDIRSEVPFGTGSRVDFLAGTPEGNRAYVEVKSVTLARNAPHAEFPDTVTKRGTKHIHELEKAGQSGDRAIMLYLLQRTDCQAVTLAGDIDPTYVAAAQGAQNIDFLAYRTTIDPTGISISGACPFSWVYAPPK